MCVRASGDATGEGRSDGEMSAGGEAGDYRRCASCMVEKRRWRQCASPRSQRLNRTEATVCEIVRIDDWL